MTNLIEVEKEVEILLEEIDGDYNHWTIGVSDDPFHASLKYGDPVSWHEWDVDSANEGLEIKNHFIRKGMQAAGEETGDDENYVYVFHNVDSEA